MMKALPTKESEFVRSTSVDSVASCEGVHEVEEEDEVLVAMVASVNRTGSKTQTPEGSTGCVQLIGDVGF